MGGGGHEKQIVGNIKKGVTWTVYRFKRGLGEKERGDVSEGRGLDIPMQRVFYIKYNQELKITFHLTGSVGNPLSP